MKRLLVLAACALALFTAPVLADKPTIFTVRILRHDGVVQVLQVRAKDGHQARQIVKQQNPRAKILNLRKD